MKLIKVVLVAFVLLLNLAIAQPSLAGRPKLTQTTDYTEVTQALDKLLQAKKSPDESSYTPEKIQQKLGELQLQKYILETATEWAQCSNQTGNTLAVYAHKAKKSSQAGTLYYLGDGQITDDDWNCDGIYLPSGTKVAGLSDDAQELTEPLAVKIVGGTQLVAKTNPETSAVEFNVAPAKVFKAGESTWSIPNLSAADVSAQAPNAPIED